MAPLKNGQSQSNSQAGGVTESYDVFVNFRGSDTRDNLVSVLRDHLKRAPGNIVHFYDDESMRSGDEISEKLKQGIRNSQMYICVFSKSYADSKWCLRELKLMNDERKENGKHILPIFYEVKVEDVKLKKGSIYLDQLLEVHQAEDPRTVDQWREALIEVARIKGHKMSDFRDLTKLSEAVVRDVDRLLTTRPLSYFLVGMEEKVLAVVDRLDVDSSDVQVLIIHGESGIGKTTLAREVFKRLRGTCFENFSFVEDIDGSQLHRPQPSSYTYFMKQVLEDIPNHGRDEEMKKNHPSPIGREELKRRFCENFRNKKVLIVLDNVTKESDITQLKSVWFGPGSRIIVTTDVTRILALAEDSTIKSKRMKVEGLKVKSFKMEGLGHKQALQLFSRHAFRKDSPPKEFKTLSVEIVSQTGGLPLMLEIVGAFLHRKSREDFIQTQEKLNGINSTTNKRDKVQEMLRISYEALSKEAKDIFLDIACFFVNKEKNRAVHMWENTYHTSTVEDLTIVSLVKIKDNEKLWMHDRLRKMGRDIVQKDEEPNRLWKHKEALAVLESGEESRTVRALRICNDDILENYQFGPQHFRMKKLQFLQLYLASADGKMEHLKLRWLSWRCCRANSLEADLFAVSLVILDLSFSSITHEWSGWNKLKEKAVYLRVLDLKGCKELTRTPSLCGYHELERLILEDCQKLESIDSSICESKKLKYLNLKGCDALQELPEKIGDLDELVELVITKRNGGSLVLPKSIERLKSLRILEIINVKFADLPLPIPVEGQETLTRLSLFKCSVNFKKLPESLGNLTSLVELDISSTNFVELNDSMKSLKELKVLRMQDSMIRSLPSDIEELKNLEELHAKCSKLEGEVPEGIGKLSKLKILDLSSTNMSYLRSKLPENLECLRLTFWSPRVCESTEERIWTCNLGCVAIDDLCQRMSLVNLAVLDTTRNLPEVKGAFSLDWIGKLTKLERLELVVPTYTEIALESQNFAFPDHLKSLKLSCKELSWCSKLPSDLSTLSLTHVEVPIDFQTLLINSKKLSSLSLYSYLGRSIKVDHVTSLLPFSASSCDFGLGKELHLPDTLQVLSLKMCKFQVDSLLDLSLLKGLKQLELVDCDGLVEVKGIGQLDQLQELHITKCDSLKSFGDWKFLEAIKQDEIPNCSFSCRIFLPRIGLVCSFLVK